MTLESAEKLSVTVTPAMARMIREKVEGGSYGSASEVVRAALRALQRDDEEHIERMAAIRERIKSSIDDRGPGYTGQQVMDHIRRRLEARVGELHEDPAGPLD